MSGISGRRLLIIITLLIISLSSAESSTAQAVYTASISTPDTSNFPHITAYLDVHDPAGAFLHGLTTQDVSLQENGVMQPASELEEQRPGIQFVIAITPGASFYIRDSLGITRYDYLLKGLLAGTWVSQPPGVDDISLLTKGGPQQTHLSNPASLLSSLESYKPNDPNLIPSLEVLTAALQVASDPTVRPGMERAVLFITPPQETDISLGLQSIIASANQQNIHIYVWLLAAQEVFTLPEIEQLKSLADQTYGSFFAFSHDEAIPDLEILLEPLRYVYKLGYDSQVNTVGPQQVSAQITVGSEVISTPVQSFDINLQAPVPVILNAPSEIVRNFLSQPTPVIGAVTGDLLPAEQPLMIQVAFPDGYDRAITITRLYVDGVIAIENTTPPFTRLVWDLRQYTQDGDHSIRVEVVDSLGLVGETAETTIRIVIPSTTQGIIVAVSQKRPLIIGVTVVITASILILVLIVGGRIRPKPHPGQAGYPSGSGEKTLPAGYRSRLQQRKDPVTQPVKIASTPPVKARAALGGWKERIPWLKRKEEPVLAVAYLIPLAGSDEPTLPAPLQITANDVTLGSDPHQANLVIADPSIQAVHSRLHMERKSFMITDAGSIAGTWVNYVQVPPQGTTLAHMDIIHLGRIGFRFKLSASGQLRKIVVTPLEPDQ